jgi:SAM-dependent methyltransferase
MSALERLGLQPQFDDGPASSSPTQDQTGRAFGFKWARRSSYEAEPMQAFTREWLLEKYCDGDPAVVDGWLAGGRKLILDAGCGAGYSALLLFGDRLREHDYLGVDISDSVAVARTRFREHGMPGDFLQADVMNLPIPDSSVDLVFSEGVLHHTDDTCAAMASLTRKLRPGGRFCFYVYARKGPIREFTDDFVRQHIAPMDDEAAWEALRPLTRLGMALGELDVQLDVPEDIPWLGISAGRVDLQRFFYYAVMKAYYRPDFGFDELHHINFDWFRPANCHRHTEEQVRACCDHAGLEIQRLHAEPSGFTVVAARR